MKERRGAGLLIFGALVLVAVAGGVSYWVTHRDQQSSLLVFHWVPGPGPLRIVGKQPFYNDGEDIAGMLDPRLLDQLRVMAIGGELRFVTDLSLRPRHAGALLLRSAPTAPITLKLADRRAAVYVEQGSGIAVFPEKSSLSGASIVLTPDERLTSFTFITDDGPGAGTSGGFSLASWW